MEEQTFDNLRFYSRRLAIQLKNKEGHFDDLQRRFSKLQGQFAELDNAFKQNLLLHQQQMIEVYELRVSQREIRKDEKDSWKRIRDLEARLKEVTREKEAAENGLDYWRRAVIDQKTFYEGNFEECVRECKMRMQTAETVNQKTIRETKLLAEKHIQELADRLKLNEEKFEIIKKKEIVLRGDFDVLRYRTAELASLIENLPGIETSDNLQAFGSCVVKVLRSLSTPLDDYENRIKELRQELLRRMSEQTLIPEGDIPDYKTLKSQNLVLREVVKKLKNELTKVEKREAILAKPLRTETWQSEELRKELIPSNTEKKKPFNFLAEKDGETRESDSENREKISELKMGLELTKSNEKERPMISREEKSEMNNTIKSSKAEKTEEKLGIYIESLDRRNFNDDGSQEAYFGLLREEGVEKLKNETRRDMIKSLELNLGALNSERSSVKNRVGLKDEEKVEGDTGSSSNGGKNERLLLSRGRIEPFESHLNSVQYKEYTILLSENQNLKIRHPVARGETAKVFRFKSVYSEKDYRNIPMDEAVLYFDFEKSEQLAYRDPKITDCAVQTMSIQKANVFTQTTTSKESLGSQGNTGVKILNSESRAIERSLRDLEKTVSEAGEETLGHARSLIVNTRKFPPSEEFFDCVRLLSRCKSN